MKPSRRSRNLKRWQLWKLRRLERQRMLAESYWDKNRAELISMHTYLLHCVDPGDVLFDQRAYVHPHLEKYM